MNPIAGKRNCERANRFTNQIVAKIATVHRVECQGHPHAVSIGVKLHERRDIIWLNTRNEIGQVCICEPSLVQGVQCYPEAYRNLYGGAYPRPFRGYEPTEKIVQWLGAALFRFENSAIVELWVLGDLAGLDALLKAQADGEEG
jgi:hypothetical protein